MNQRQSTAKEAWSVVGINSLEIQESINNNYIITHYKKHFIARGMHNDQLQPLGCIITYKTLHNKKSQSENRPAFDERENKKRVVYADTVSVTAAS